MNQTQKYLLATFGLVVLVVIMGVLGAVFLGG